MIIGVCDAPLLLSISLRKLQVWRKASVAAKTINVLYTIKKFKALFRRTQSNFHAPPEASTETVSARFHAPETLFKAFHKWNQARDERLIALRGNKAKRHSHTYTTCKSVVHARLAKRNPHWNKEERRRRALTQFPLKLIAFSLRKTENERGSVTRLHIQHTLGAETNRGGAARDHPVVGTPRHEDKRKSQSSCYLGSF
jgi:hypothetical protein